MVKTVNRRSFPGTRAPGPAQTSVGSANLLVVDDDPVVVLSLKTFFQKKGFEVQGCDSGAAALELLQGTSFDVVLLDLLLPDVSGMELLLQIKEHYPDLAVMVMSGAGTIESAVQAVKAGAEDFFTKPFVLENAALTLRRTLEMRRLQKQNTYYRKLLHDELQQELLGTSAAQRRVREFITLMSENADATVVIQGESGVGKGLVARAIHARSPRSSGAFVEINCSSLSESLLESELFGHEKGAFTGAVSRKPGLFQVADGGTLFLDEISDLPLAVQPKLLTAIESRCFRHLGGTRDLHSNVRVIVSTNRSLKRAVTEGRFREDLFYRLNVMSIEVPPLRERKEEDIPVLTEHFLTVFTPARGSAPAQLKQTAMRLLMAYHWPGNIRELRNVIERAVILARGNPIGPEHLPQDLTHQLAVQSASEGTHPLRTLQEVEIAHIRAVLKATGFNHSRSARVLGLHRTTVLDKIKKYRLEP